MKARTAVIADIHGNRWALEAVLEDVKHLAIEQIVNLGDVLYGPLDPSGTAELLQSLDIPTVRGNEDRILFDAPTRSTMTATIEYVANQISRDQIRWIEDLPITRTVGDDLFLCHGTPQADTEYLLEQVCVGGTCLRSAEQIQASVSGVAQRLILCGHSHTPRVVSLPTGQLVVNPGSVGLQAYDDDQPASHIVETGSPHARYCVLSASGDRWSIDQRLVSYDWDAAAAVASKNGRDDWASWLKTGRAYISDAGS